METLLVLSFSSSGISTCSGDLEINISGVLFISLYQDIDREIVGLIRRSGVLL